MTLIGEKSNSSAGNQSAATGVETEAVAAVGLGDTGRGGRARRQRAGEERRLRAGEGDPIRGRRVGPAGAMLRSCAFAEKNKILGKNGLADASP
jgi:hypothetical protein